MPRFLRQFEYAQRQILPLKKRSRNGHATVASTHPTMIIAPSHHTQLGRVTVFSRNPHQLPHKRTQTTFISASPEAEARVRDPNESCVFWHLSFIHFSPSVDHRGRSVTQPDFLYRSTARRARPRAGRACGDFTYGRARCDGRAQGLLLLARAGTMRAENRRRWSGRGGGGAALAAVAAAWLSARRRAALRYLAG